MPFFSARSAELLFVAAPLFSPDEALGVEIRITFSVERHSVPFFSARSAELLFVATPLFSPDEALGR